jgi:hypothetical protein
VPFSRPYCCENSSKYIAIHARRHKDFLGYCNGQPKEECFPSIPTFQRRVGEIQEETRERLGGVVPRHVIMLSDEGDPAWWDSIREVGWYSVDHVAEDTVNKYGRWCVLYYLGPLVLTT